MESLPVTEVTGPAPPTSKDDVLIRLLADYGDDGRFGKRVLEVTKDNVRILEAAGAESLRVPISAIKTARNEPLVGGGRLELQLKSGEILPIVSYSLTVAPKFSEAARGIEQLSKGEPLLITLKEERLRCEKCNRLLPEKNGT
jgi:ATP-binding cassette subfamily B protein